MIAIVDYGMGNLRSVQKALERVGAPATLTPDPRLIERADALILPGVGAFPKAMREIERRGLREPIIKSVREGTPTLGICLGLQLLCEHSTELGGADGLGLLPGRVERLDAEQLPQIGWNPVTWVRSDPLVEGLGSPCPMYHVHTFTVRPADPELTLGRADYSGERFTSAVARPPLYGVQFHPEKSGPAGLRLLSNFAQVADRALAAA